jgi:hypothetical protein
MDFYFKTNGQVNITKSSHLFLGVEANAGGGQIRLAAITADHGCVKT